MRYSIGEVLIWPNGTKGPVTAVDPDDNQIMDPCGGWHDEDDMWIMPAAQVLK